MGLIIWVWLINRSDIRTSVSGGTLEFLGGYHKNTYKKWEGFQGLKMEKKLPSEEEKIFQHKTSEVLI